METRCPRCHTIFRIEMEQLSVAKGQVRCGQCNHVFNAADEIVVGGRVASEDVPGLETKTIEVPDIEVEEIHLDEPAAAGEATTPAFPTEEDTGAEEDIEVEAETTTVDSEKPGEKGYDITVLYPELENPPALPVPPSTRATLTWSILILLLLVLLTGQLGYFMRDKLARNHALRPLLESMCDVMQCELKGQRAPSLIRLLSHKVLSHPQDKRALRVEAVIVNEAGFVQDYPVMRLQFRDLDGKLLATRNFLPRNYLPTDVDPKTGMTPGEPVNTVLDIIDPGKTAISYEFDFL